jgi:hypothetical protein
MLGMKLIETMQRLCARGINCGMQFLCDVGIEVWLGDDKTASTDRKLFKLNESDEAAQWLSDTAISRYPGAHKHAL